MNRRHFLMSTAVMVGGTAVKGLAQGPTQSPNETVRMAVIGLGGRGSSHVNAWSRMKNVEVAAICDVDESHIGEKFKLLESRGARKPTTHVDIRKLLERKDIDAVSIATPNHWHALATIWACQAGKDVYVEKPVLAQRLRRPADGRSGPRSTTGSCSTGSAEPHVSEALREAVEHLRKGELGKVYMARGLCYKSARHHRQDPRRADAARDLNWDLWQDPRPGARLLEANRSTTTGTGTGTTATATSATRASTKPTCASGASASTPPDQDRRHGRQVPVGRRQGDPEHDLPRATSSLDGRTR